MAERELLFSLTKRDFVVETFRAGGKGGQHQNKTDSAVRIRHPASGAVAESREHRSQAQNKAAAFRRLTETARFKMWHAEQCMRLLGQKTPEQVVAEQMADRHLRVEVHDEQGRWTPWPVVEPSPEETT